MDAYTAGALVEVRRGGRWRPGVVIQRLTLGSVVVRYSTLAGLRSGIFMLAGWVRLVPYVVKR